MAISIVRFFKEHFLKTWTSIPTRIHHSLELRSRALIADIYRDEVFNNSQISDDKKRARRMYVEQGAASGGRATFGDAIDYKWGRLFNVFHLPTFLIGGLKNLLMGLTDRISRRIHHSGLSPMVTPKAAVYVGNVFKAIWSLLTIPEFISFLVFDKALGYVFGDFWLDGMQQIGPQAINKIRGFTEVQKVSSQGDETTLSGPKMEETNLDVKKGELSVSINAPPLTPRGHAVPVADLQLGVMPIALADAQALDRIRSRHNLALTARGSANISENKSPPPSPRVTSVSQSKSNTLQVPPSPRETPPSTPRKMHVPRPSSRSPLSSPVLPPLAKARPLPLLLLPLATVSVPLPELAKSSVHIIDLNLKRATRRATVPPPRHKKDLSNVPEELPMQVFGDGVLGKGQSVSRLNSESRLKRSNSESQLFQSGSRHKLMGVVEEPVVALKPLSL